MKKFKTILFALCMILGISLTGCSQNSNSANDTKPANESSKFSAPVSSNPKDYPNITLNSGYKMPSLGIGTYSLKGDVCFESVYTAISEGYRLIDTAYMYENEEEVGKAVRQAIEDGLVKREDIFVITKIYPSQFSEPEKAIDMALE